MTGPDTMKVVPRHSEKCSRHLKKLFVHCTKFPVPPQRCLVDCTTTPTRIYYQK